MDDGRLYSDHYATLGVEVLEMSQSLMVELSDDVYAAIERQSAEACTSPAHVIATSLEQYFRQSQSA